MNGLELRLASLSERTVEGVVVPYGETTYLTSDPRGERFRPGSLTRTINQRGNRIKLFRSHDHNVAVGKPVTWKPASDGGCWAQFQIANTPAGDDVLNEVREGMLDMFSVGFRTVREARGADGAREIVEAELHEVSIVPMGAYDGARVLTMRSPSTTGALEWTTFDRRPPHSKRAIASSYNADAYARERRRAEAANYARRHPDHAVMGCAIPYGRGLPSHNGETLWFDTDTEWILTSPIVPIELEHGGNLVGHATLTEEFNGTFIDGTIYNAMHKRVNGRHQLSPKIDQVVTTPRPDGALQVRHARLLEVSLCNAAMWRPHTDAVVFQRAS